MANILVINPPFKFKNGLEELNELFKPVEKFEVIYHTEALSESTTYSFGLISSICSYIRARNHTDAMIERYAIIEEALRESLKYYKITVDKIVEVGKEKINRELEILKKEIQKAIMAIKKEYRVAREKVREKLKLEEIKNKIKKKLEKMYIQIREIIKITLETFEDKYSDYIEYTRLNDEYIEIEKKYIDLIKLKGE